jgi:hypothetical protein
MQLSMIKNPGVGLRLTDSRIQKETESISPGPQAYNVCIKLTERERNQNELMSHRYKDWHRKNKKVEISGCDMKNE